MKLTSATHDRLIQSLKQLAKSVGIVCDFTALKSLATNKEFSEQEAIALLEKKAGEMHCKHCKKVVKSQISIAEVLAVVFSCKECGASLAIPTQTLGLQTKREKQARPKKF